ncbi:hypothetical protein HMPREF9071_0338 [Capnocytophaga sp. oral taxon 338 str. F0234]|jgi:hypothetical protein|nr:hypothetical protein HMPREF9071_0338 [Capnocytophaga sp. oral taxon 338 str. F0234]
MVLGVYHKLLTGLVYSNLLKNKIKKDYSLFCKSCSHFYF